MLQWVPNVRLGFVGNKPGGVTAVQHGYESDARLLSAPPAPGRRRAGTKKDNFDWIPSPKAHCQPRSDTGRRDEQELQYDAGRPRAPGAGSRRWWSRTGNVLQSMNSLKAGAIGKHFRRIGTYAARDDIAVILFNHPVDPSDTQRTIDYKKLRLRY